jgi:hypothetical protein
MNSAIKHSVSAGTGGILAALATLALMGVFDKAKIPLEDKVERKATTSTLISENLAPNYSSSQSYLEAVLERDVQIWEQHGYLEFGWAVDDTFRWYGTRPEYLNSRPGYHEDIWIYRKPRIVSWAIIMEDTIVEEHFFER